jgi:uncharacterized protein (TIGR02270 family)
MQRARRSIPIVAYQHAKEAASLRGLRGMLVCAPHVKLSDLRRFDDRIASHLDGLRVADSVGLDECRAALENPGVGEVFALAVLAIENREEAMLAKLISLAASLPDAWRGLLSATGWVSASELQGWVRLLLISKDPWRRALGIATCGIHRVDPGVRTARLIEDDSSLVRASALRTVGEVGSVSMEGECLAALADDDTACQFWATWSSVLLGNRDQALRILEIAGRTPGRHQSIAYPLALQASSQSDTHKNLQQLAKESSHLRLLIQGCGIAGDTTYLTWLIGQMADETVARLVGEAFSLITGMDLELAGLEGKGPTDFESGPNDNPQDPNVEMDPDDGLPWPDAEKVATWWSANESRFQKGLRYFMGAPVTRHHCLYVLRNGYQRQRILAAQYLCLLEPGTPLFNTSAPAWRQQRLLAKMS